MTIQECIKQLESLRAHCDAMDDGKLDSMDCWNKDVKALDMALNALTGKPEGVWVCICAADLIEWLMPYVHLGKKVDPEAVIEEIRRMAQKELEKSRSKKSGWIKCSDRMPDIGQKALVLFNGKTAVVGYWDTGDDDENEDVFCCDAVDTWKDEPTHWMPLPEPPEATK